MSSQLCRQYLMSLTTADNQKNTPLSVGKGHIPHMTHQWHTVCWCRLQSEANWLVVAYTFLLLWVPCLLSQGVPPGRINKAANVWCQSLQLVAHHIKLLTIHVQKGGRQGGGKEKRSVHGFLFLTILEELIIAECCTAQQESAAWLRSTGE